MKIIFNKKAGIMDAQFSWIFAFMIGIVVLGFFVTIGMTQQSSTKNKLSIETMKTFRSVFISASTRVNYFLKINLVSMDMNYRCENGNSRFISGNQVEEINLPLFTQSNIRGSEFYIFSTQWFMPYFSTSFIFLSSENYYFYIIKPNDLENPVFKELIEIIPEDFPYQVISKENISDVSVDSDREVKLITFQKNPDSNYIINELNSASLRSVRNLYLLNIDSDLISNSDGIYGNLTFYEYKKMTNNFNNVGSFDYLSFAPIIGAIFTTDYDDYLCVYKEVLSRTLDVTQVNQKKIQAVHDHYKNQPPECPNCNSCAYYYNQANNTLSNIDYFLGSDIYSINKNLLNYYRQLVRENNNALAASCISIY